ncbi:hypothetical protein [Suttonella ornithocola]|uniref:Uncharacterized protein conserved in bacteria n=1 Tax=Suttonella ornithocola TaxID=279832 RepID=A0A380MTU3_9GAMM|nr:hypothetical protein [Suttonella ornithocola]SUO95614.1 Uncharacterized protein conserved in bacteria [Suttonella ornithocola]
MTHLSIGDVTTYLDNTYQDYLANPKQITDIIKNHIQALKDHQQMEAPSTELFFPLLVTEDWLSQAQAQLTEIPEYQANQALIELPLVAPNGLKTVGIFDYPSSIAYATEKLTEQFKTIDEAIDAGINNLYDYINQNGINTAQIENYPIYQLQLNGIFDSALWFIIDQLIPVISTELTLENTLIAIPARDTFLIAQKEDAEAMAFLQTYVQNIFENATHPISPTLYKAPSI